MENHEAINEFINSTASRPYIIFFCCKKIGGILQNRINRTITNKSFNIEYK